MNTASVLLLSFQTEEEELGDSQEWGSFNTSRDIVSKSLRRMTPSQDHSVIVVWSLSHVRLCDPTACSVPGSSVLHHLLEFAPDSVHCTESLRSHSYKRCTWPSPEITGGTGREKEWESHVIRGVMLLELF